MDLIESKISVVGAGTMGTGIAQIAATHGHETILIDKDRRQLERSQASLEKILKRLTEKEKITATKAAEILSRITFTSNLDIGGGSGLAVEAVVEDLDTKQQLLAKLESILSEDAVLATNTSSLSVTSISNICKNPERVIGMHFFNPAPVMALVEVVPALDTLDEVKDNVVKLAYDWNKIPVLAKDTPGFIVNRVARPFYGESLRMVDEGFASPEEVDVAMRQTGGFRMGPFELMDLIGNDINLKVTETVFNAFYQDPRYRPSFTQKRLVEAGRLGRKTGRGYFFYGENAGTADAIVEGQKAEAIVNRVITMIMNEAIDAVFWGVATPEDVDLAMTNGVNYPKGPIAWAQEIGLGVVLERMQALRSKYTEDRYRPSPLLKQHVESGTVLYAT